MCSEQRIFMLVQMAKLEEQENPSQAAKKYLEAAQLLLAYAEKEPEREEAYLNVIQMLYERAKKVQQSQPVQISTFAQVNHLTTIANHTDTVTFDSIGGLEQLKEDIRLKIIEPFRQPELFRYYGKKTGGGILMYGPPGCGKSLIAKATANEARASFIHVKGSDMKSKFVGETEKNIAALFQKAKEEQPTIIFFDEFDALGNDRSDSLSHEKSAVAQLLTEMDGFDSKDQQILLLAATNEPWSIDPALRREGRFGTTIFVPQPDETARRHILQRHMQNKPIQELNFDALAKMTHGFSGADLKAVCEKATDYAVKDSLQTKERRAIVMQDMKKAIATHTSVLQQWFRKAKDQLEKRKLTQTFQDLYDAAQVCEMQNSAAQDSMLLLQA